MAVCDPKQKYSNRILKSAVRTLLPYGLGGRRSDQKKPTSLIRFAMFSIVTLVTLLFINLKSVKRKEYRDFSWLNFITQIQYGNRLVHFL